MCSLLPRIWPSSRLLPYPIPTSRRPGNYGRQSGQTRPLTPLSILCRYSRLLIPFPALSGGWLSRITSLTLRNSLPRWIKGTTTTTSLETLVEVMQSSRRSKLQLSGPFDLNLNGFVSSEPGAQPLFWFIATALWSFKAINAWSLIYFVQYLMTCRLPSLSMSRLEIAMQRVLSAWTIGLSLTCHFWHACSRVLAHLPRSAATRHLHQALPRSAR